MNNWSDRINALNRRVSVHLRIPSGDYIAAVTTLDPGEIHKGLWYDVYPTFSEAQKAAHEHCGKTYAELQDTSWQNVSCNK